MSGRRAKAIRRHVYGDASPRARRYAGGDGAEGETPRTDAQRLAYRRAKRAWRRRGA